MCSTAVVIANYQLGDGRHQVSKLLTAPSADGTVLVAHSTSFLINTKHKAYVAAGCYVFVYETLLQTDLQRCADSSLATRWQELFGMQASVKTHKKVNCDVHHPPSRGQKRQVGGEK